MRKRRLPAKEGKGISLLDLVKFDDPKGLYSPTAGAVNPWDPSALYITIQDGLILRYDIDLDKLDTANPFFDIRDEILEMRNAATEYKFEKGKGTDFSHYRYPDDFTELSDERGLLGLAFNPATENEFFIYYSAATDRKKLKGTGTAFALDHYSVVKRVTVDPSMEQHKWKSEEVLRISQPQWNHNGGMLMFGPHDKYLYIGMGDGGGANDEHGRIARKYEPMDKKGVLLLNEGDPKSYLGFAQDLTVPWGKILRIDVNPKGKAFDVPKDNPFVSKKMADVMPMLLRGAFMSGWFQSMIYAYGFRNPWKFDISSTGQIFVGDVGQSKEEEITIVSKPGENHGWRAMEGKSIFNQSVLGVMDIMKLVAPIFTYVSKPGGAVVGGYVIENGTHGWNELNKAFPVRYPTRQARGRFYVFGDLSGKVMLGLEIIISPETISPRWELKVLFELKDRNIHSFAKDQEGRVYVLHKTSFSEMKKEGARNILAISRLEFGKSSSTPTPKVESMLIEDNEEDQSSSSLDEKATTSSSDGNEWWLTPE